MSRRLIRYLVLVLLWLALPSPLWASSPAEEPAEVARQALGRLTRMVEEGRPFGPQDAAWLSGLQESLGRATMSVPDPDRPGATRILDTRLTPERLNAFPDSARVLRDTLATVLEATDNPPRIRQLGEIHVPVHNHELGEFLKPTYGASSFRALFEKARQMGIFALKIDSETGLASTSGVSSSENPEMSERQWVTDTIRTGEYKRKAEPAGWRRALLTLARFYTNPTEQAAFDRAIADPDTYRQGGPEEGVAHIFYPQTLQRDPDWFNNQRLESHGLALGALVQALTAGMVHQEPWGFADSEAVDDRILKTIANLTAYFVALDYPSAPSAGNWEETPFPGGLTWDTEAIRSGLALVRDFMANPAYDANPEVVRVRQRLLEQPHGALLGRTAELDRWIEAGSRRVRRTFLAESPGHREMDSSLVFLASSSGTLADDPRLDVALNLELLGTLERALVREDGMIRYAPFTLVLQDGTQVRSPDSYLTMNYHIAIDREGRINLEWKRILDEFGSKDASDPAVFAARASLSTSDREAEWFMVSDLARGYVRQAMKILDSLEGRQPSRDERALLDRAWAGATRNLNRGYARVTGSGGGLKSNGVPAPAAAVPEAWQYVSRLPSGSARVPGANTPLAWAQVSLWGASGEFLAGLERLEAAGLLP
ncbi:MAG: hypothetical protein GX934_09200 [Burkholderiales bacterium]|nr:hypothetical protein [Burkholderiales bacterium]